MSNNSKRMLSVYIGRFSPFHNGHAEVLRQTFSQSNHVLILIGSANSPRTIKDPWTFEERKSMITNYLVDQNISENLFTIKSLEDEPYNDHVWVENVLSTIDTLKDKFDSNYKNVFLTGSKRDWTSYYLEMFPTLQKAFIQENERTNFNLNATTVRNTYFSSVSYEFVDDLMKVLPESSIKYLINFKSTNYYNQLQKEFNFINKYKSAWAVAPYAPTFVTVDSVVVQSGHILLIERKSEPGKGLWALPGGFVEHNEKLFDASIRELREETKLKVPEPVIRGSCISKEIFDHPNRSLRGRTFTIAYLYVLKDQESLPEVKASDDAKAAKWFSLSQVKEMRDLLFEDHYSIVKTMISRIKS